MGKVFLIGAGPGDPELMTLKAVRALRAADVVLVDDLVNRECLAHARPDARIIRVGKRGGCRSTPQQFIDKLLVRYAKQGRTIARLKGGDPFVFGRGGEEMLTLTQAGIEVEVIPGITAGIGVPAALGIPVTHRRIASGVIFLTGHTEDGGEPNWDALARSGLTLVIYMGVSRLQRIIAELRKAGMPAEMPACVIENGTLATQRQRVTTLGNLSAEGFGSPAIVVVGDVVRFAQVATAVPTARAA
ncbi:MAG TPA: uroporphyrinogen-III C-methyltransferase [Burkholderiales bacterium]|jgi:uroporphyrin-III C-methyltransferase|nr:uroporphyrinogen-III C-methyltransferase [Burkholderiales bacterium]